MYERIRRDTINDFPEVVQEIKEFKAMSKSNNITNNKVADDIEQLEKDMHYDTMSKEMCEVYEKTFGLGVSSADSLTFRRERIKNRDNLKPPFSRPYMKERLDEIIGRGKYDLTINCNNKSITVEASMENKPYFEELYITFSLMKPCTMVFITKPYTKSGLVLLNSSEYAKVTYRKMGSGMKMNGWKMGTKRE